MDKVILAFYELCHMLIYRWLKLLHTIYLAWVVEHPSFWATTNGLVAGSACMYILVHREVCVYFYLWWVSFAGAKGAAHTYHFPLIYFLTASVSSILSSQNNSDHQTHWYLCLLIEQSYSKYTHLPLFSPIILTSMGSLKIYHTWSSRGGWVGLTVNHEHLTCRCFCRI